MSNLTKRIAIGVIILITLTGLFLVTIGLEYIRVVEKEKDDLDNYLDHLKAEIDKRLNQRIFNVRGFIPYIQLNPDMTQDEFVEYASRLISEDDIVIKDVTFATDTTITHYYPVEGNEAIMGVDLLTLPGQDVIVQMVKDKGQIVIDGPFQIVEGGPGIICRIPVYIDSETEMHQYFGQLNYVVNFNVFLEETGINKAMKEFKFEIIQLSGIDNTKKTIVSNTDEFSDDAVTVRLIMPNVEWDITIEYVEGINGRSMVFYMLCILGTLVIVLSVIYTNRIMKSEHNLEFSIKALKETQEKLVLSEKLAALGSLVAGVAHEMNTPLGNLITMVTYTEKNEKAVLEKFKDGSLTKVDLELFLEKNIDSHILATKSLDKIITLINKFKQLTSFQGHSELVRIDLKKYLVELMDQLITEVNAGVSVQYAIDDIVILSDPEALSLIISNLFENTMVHGFDNFDKGEVSINAYRDTQNKTIVLKYWDNGVGVSKEIREDIFTPFYTTKKSSGHVGLGLHIVFNAVVNTLKGDIELIQDEKGRDVFMITLPESIMVGGGQ